MRIKFLGDCYYGISGAPVKNKRHAKNCVDLGLKMISEIREVRLARNLNIDMRIGVHSGKISFDFKISLNNNLIQQEE